MLTIKEIKDQLKSHPQLKAVKLSEMISQNEQLLTEMRNYDLDIADVRYHLKNDLPFQKHTCNVCGKTIHYNNKILGFAKTCSRECSFKDPSRAEKIKQTKLSQDQNIITAKRKATNLKKYGTENPQTLAKFKEKQIKTNLEKYGTEYIFQSDLVKAKIKQTNLKRYGVENPALSDVIKQKAAETCIKKYGFKSSALNEHIKAKTITTNLKRYGVETPIKNIDIRNKVIATNQSKYGVDFPFQSLAIQEKICQSNLVSHGSKCSLLDPNVKAIADKALIDLYGDNWRSVFAERSNQTKFNNTYPQIKANAINADLEFLCNSAKEFKGKGYKYIYEWKCLKCGKIFKAYFSNAKYPSCPKCHKSYISEFQLSIVDYIKSLSPNIKYQLNNRKIISPLELDIYFPDLNIAIETNGDYWHSTYCHPESGYHLNKTELCESKDIHLIHIFEHEWINNSDKIKARLSNIFRNTSNNISIYARKCQVKSIVHKVANEFLDKFHMQNHIRCSLALGLYYNNNLISVMTFGKPRFNKNYEWELLRFASSSPVIGGASKLLKYFERNYKPKNLISYANRCWSSKLSNVYSKIGFSLVDNSAPSYWYVKNHIALSRYQCQKHKLKNIIDSVDDTKSEEWNMLNNGYLKIHDCGNLVFSKTY